MSSWPFEAEVTSGERRGAAPAPMRIGASQFEWGARTYIMGILNVTPDSFSGDGVYRDVAAAVERGLRLAADGADLIDVGGESTRPGHGPVSAHEELRRVLPVVRELVGRSPVPLSIDTSKAVVADAAVAAGASLINDVSGLFGDDRMGEVAQTLGVPVIVMARGAARTPDVVQRVQADLRDSFQRAERAGIDPSRLLIDPGFGFGKTWRDNLELVRRLPALSGTGMPLVVGISRKSTIARVLGRDSQFGVAPNAALTALAVYGGADIVRVHDVGPMRDAARLADAVVRPVINAR